MVRSHGVSQVVVPQYIVNSKLNANAKWGHFSLHNMHSVCVHGDVNNKFVTSNIHLR